ncbi:hypothetical protein V6N11_069492 [Hibiscus sabdariffa]|uniref:DUF4283 domain-containing protein n=1 Tax=Hibiscus sabdariffa TaxID=183260 RepID=A0ABR2Q3I8_9ROSI
MVDFEAGSSKSRESPRGAPFDFPPLGEPVSAAGDSDVVAAPVVVGPDVVVGGLDLSHFPVLVGSGKAGQEICSSRVGDENVGKNVWKMFDPSLNFFPPVEQKGQLLVQPPRSVLDDGANQWSNVLVVTFLGKSPILSVFQKTVDRLWGREVDLGEGFLVSVGVELVWAPPRCLHCSVFERLEENCLKLKSVSKGVFGHLDQDITGVGVAPMIETGLCADGVGFKGNVASSSEFGPYLTISIANAHVVATVVLCTNSGGFVDNVVLELGSYLCIDADVNGVVGSSLNISVAHVAAAECTVSGGIVDSEVPKLSSGLRIGADVTSVVGSLQVESVTVNPIGLVLLVGSQVEVDMVSGLVSPNRFETLSAGVADHIVSPRKEKATAAVVGDLLNQLKPKGKGVEKRITRRVKVGQVVILLLCNDCISMECPRV